ncbi:LPXTG-motif cell wall anchor domain-containing protein [Gracilibacillus halophilus YIM-C55.5]|uniref:LPXTG-motif cell wall anchor domain-containing protein n=1 Tax=Gracilibacillus halophilus YIM-C55.5 TaxID=1308866 RepID=N4WQK4_9BACI|nr:hypothetical protein [Gracilibacillus halophilus]ENH98407.1 LPXTG-motif cell wall anchor domain-containing protein [Gracilibacillus halophilus YIM-C55.5]
MKRFSYWLLLLPLLTILYAPIEVSATSQDSLIQISGDLSADGKLFQLENVKPGDWANRKLSLSNVTNHDVHYRMDVQYTDGSKQLYQALKLKITNSNETVLFDDALANLSNQTEQTLRPNSNETFHFQLRFPSELGNEYQGLTTNADIIISAEGNSDTQESSFPLSSDSQIPTHDNLPDTATFIFRFFLVGTVLFTAGTLLLLYAKARKTA